MAKKGSFSKVYDKNGDYVDVEAARFDGTRTFQMQGDVSATQTWNGDSASALTLNTSIGAKKVTTDKINDKAVQTGQIDDGAVGLTQIATNAMNGTVQDNDSKLATHAAVKTYVDSQISGQGTYLGKHTVAEINAMATDNLHNGDRVMTSDSGTINLGPGGVGFDVEAGEDLILYKSGSTVQWDSMDGNFKTKQTAVSDPTASGTGLTFIDSASQDENGEMTLSKKTVQDGTTSQKGVVQLEDSHSSTSTTKAATPNSVKEAYDLANTANTGAVKNVAYDSTNKKITKTINGTTSDVVSVATLKTDMALNNVDNTSDANKPVSTAQQAALDLKLDKTGDGKDVTATFTEASTRANIGTGEKLSVIFGKIKKWFTDLGTAAFKNVPSSGNASSTEVVLGSDTRLSAGASAVQDVTVDGASVVNSSTKVAAVPNASTSAKGAVQLAGSIGATVASENNKAATEKAVRDAINALDAEVTSNDGTNVQVKVTEADGKISAVNVTTDNTENKNNKVSSWQTTPDDTHYPSEKLVKDGLDAKANMNNSVSVYDGYIRRMAETNGWNKIATKTFAKSGSNVNALFRLYGIGSDTDHSTFFADLVVNIRFGSGGTAPTLVHNRMLIHQNISIDAKIKIVGNSGNAVVELWLRPSQYMMLFITCIGNGEDVTALNKDWTFSKTFTADKDEPVADTSNNIYVFNSIKKYVQYDIASPTNNNLVAMDASGLVKDSGKKAADFELVANKVSSWQSTPDNTHYPSEKLVKDGLDAKADANKVVAIADAVVSRMGTTGWFKVAERRYNQVTSTAGGTWAVTIISASKNITCHYTIDLNIRAQTSGTNAAVRIFSSSPLGLSASDNYDNFRCVLNGTSGSLTIELWYYAGGAHESMMLSELATGVYNGSNTKFGWTYYNISSSIAGSETAPTGNVVKDIDFVYAQKPVANATSGDFAGLDANGMLTDSGKKAADFATSAQGSKADSAIQGVKVNSTALTPDANKVVNIPLATTSADGAMSAADKTKLDAVDNIATVNFGPSCYGILLTDLTVSTGYGTADYVATLYIDSNIGTPSATREIVDIKFIFRSNGGGSYKVWSAVSEHRMSNSSSMIPFRIAYKTSANAASIYLLWKDDGSTTSENYRVLLKTLSKFGCLTISYPLTRLSEQLTGFTLFTRRYMASTTESSGTAPVKVDAYGTLTPVPMDSTPTASSTNLMTSGDIKTALDEKQNTLPTSGTASDTYAINISGNANTARSLQRASGSSAGTSRYAKLFTIQSAYGDNLASGLVIAFTARDTNNNNKSGFLRLRLANNSESGYVTILNSGSVGNAATTRLGFLKVESGKYEVWAYLTIHSRISAYVVACDDVSFTAHSATYETTMPEGLTLFTNGLNVTKADNQAAVGSTSIPTYVDSDGEIKACTDDFVHDGDVEQTYSSSSTAPISGAGVASAISGRMPLVEVNNNDTDNPLNANDFRTTGFYHFGSGVVDTVINIPDVVAGHFVLEVLNHRGRVYQRFIAGEGQPEPGYVYSRVSKGTSSTSWQPWTKEIRGSDVASTYSATGTDPVNGTAVAAAISTKQDTLDWMTQQEAADLWTAAWNAAT